GAPLASRRPPASGGYVRGADDGASAPSGIFPRVIVRSTAWGADSRTDRCHRGVDALQKVNVLYPSSSRGYTAGRRVVQPISCDGGSTTDAMDDSIGFSGGLMGLGW